MIVNSKRQLAGNLKDTIKLALVIDGDVAMHSLIKNHLNQVDITNIDCVQSGTEAETHIKNKSYDLIIMDWKMKDPPGPILFHTLRVTYALTKIPIILMSGAITPQDVKDIREYPVTNFLVKPFTFEILIKLIEKTASFEFTILDDAVSAPPKPKAKIVTPLEAKYLNDLSSALIVDADSTITTLVKNYLGKRGTTNAVVCSNGDDAWKAIKNTPMQIIVIDWQLKGMSGLCLYNRLSNHHTKNGLKILVLSGSVEQQDFRILEENPFARFIRKPFPIEILDESIDQLTEAHENYKKATSVAATALTYMFENKSSVEYLIANALKSLELAVFVLPICAKAFLNNDMPENAEKCLKAIISRTPKNSGMIADLSKIYLRLGRHDEALKLLSQHAHINSQSVERLCLLGEAGLTLQNPEQAREHFTKVLEIDKDNDTAKAGITISKNMGAHIAGEAPLSNKLASTLNIIGITLAKQNEITKAKEQYTAAMSFVHNNDDLSKLNFNMALAYLRDKDSRGALEWFNRADEISGGTYEKARQYSQKLQTELGINNFEVNLSNKSKPISDELTTIDYSKNSSKRR